MAPPGVDFHIEVMRGPREPSVLMTEVDEANLRYCGEDEEEPIEQGRVITVRVDPRDLPDLIAWLTNEAKHHKVGTGVMCGVGSLMPLQWSVEWAKSHDGCGEVLPLGEAYRCLDCSRYYHKKCMAANHFNRQIMEALSATDR